MIEPKLPLWAENLRLRYLSGEASMFLLYGNVRDLIPWQEESGELTFLSMRSFLERFLGRSKEIVAYYNCSEGFEFPNGKHRSRFKRAINTRRLLDGRLEIPSLPRSPSEALPIIEDIITDPSQHAGIVVDYVETVVPMGELAFMGEADKANLVALQRWANDPGLVNSDNLIIMVTENLADVHRRVVSNSQLATVSVPLPDTSERKGFIAYNMSTGDVKLEMAIENFAELTAGLSLLQIRGLFRQARQTGTHITYRSISQRKKTIIEQECHGLVEFVDPGHNFSHVGGMDRIKADLMQMVHAIKKGMRNRVPMGVIFVGPMGTGKTYVAEALAAESGLTCLKFKNFREKWVGSTEGNLEKIFHVVNALGYVLLIIDEADRSLSGGSEGDGGTSSRVVARIKEFMSDTSHRGRIVTLMMTNRPDKLDTDLKRPGRFDMKVPFFFPEEPEEREAIFKALIRKNKLSIAEGVSLETAVMQTEGYSGAELEGVLLSAARLSAMEDREELSQVDIDNAVKDVIPSRDTRMLEFMEMLAVFESSARRMLPDRYREIPTDEVHARLDQLKLALGNRVR